MMKISPTERLQQDGASSPHVAIVVLNWNGMNDTLNCLQSLALIDYPSYEVILVDNGSTDGSVETIRDAFPNVLLIQTGSNLGYAGGNNVGIQSAVQHGAEYILILNNDTVLDSMALSEAVDVAQTLGDKAGAVGFATYHYEQPDVLHDVGLQDVRDGGGFYLPPEEKLKGNKSLPIASAHGCAMLLASRMLEMVGSFDDRFFLMAEEADLCIRAHQAGFAVVGATEARVWHKGSVSFEGEESLLRLFYLRRNRFLYFKKRCEEANNLNGYQAVRKTLANEIQVSAIQYLREHEIARAFNELLAMRCAEAELWGKKGVHLQLRLKVLAEILLLAIKGMFRRLRRQLGVEHKVSSCI